MLRVQQKQYKERFAKKRFLCMLIHFTLIRLHNSALLDLWKFHFNVMNELQRKELAGKLVKPFARHRKLCRRDCLRFYHCHACHSSLSWGTYIWNCHKHAVNHTQMLTCTFTHTHTQILTRTIQMFMQMLIYSICTTRRYSTLQKTNIQYTLYFKLQTHTPLSQI